MSRAECSAIEARLPCKSTLGLRSLSFDTASPVRVTRRSAHYSPGVRMGARREIYEQKVRQQLADFD